MRGHLLLALVITGVVTAATPSTPVLPPFFIPNHGQAPPAVRFMAHGSGMTAFFLPGEALFKIDGHSVRVRWIGAGSSTDIEGAEPLSAVANFLTGEEAQWRTNVPLYRSIEYRQIYPGIDMRYGGNTRDLKSEFIVAAGADPSCIRLQYLGAGAPWVADDGSLVIPVVGQQLREQAPLVYQNRSGALEQVSGRFVVSNEGIVSFAIAEYDRTLPLIIDPVLSYSTLLGGSGSDAANALAVDAAGSAYVAGYTASYDFPTANPEQNFAAGSNDIFVAKLNATGSALVYCTYIGGSADDRAFGIAVDTTGAAYVTGWTTSQNFPLRSALQSRIAGTRNAFVLKLNTAGNTLVFSTYLGGNNSDAAYGIALDSSRNVYVVGDTTSLTFPAGGLQKGLQGGTDAFVAKIAADGSKLNYSTYLGGTSEDHGTAIAVDAAGSAYVTGSTYSTVFPTAKAAQPNLAGGQDAFLAKLSPDGGSLVYGTFLGGTGGSVGSPESGQGIALDAQGNAYIAGSTSSSDFPLLHPLQASRRGSSPDAFVAKFNAAGALAYSTYLGGTSIDLANAIAVDASGSAYVVGQTYSSDLPLIGAYQASKAGDYDAFLAKLSPTGDSLTALTYLGGSGSDTATGVALDQTGGIYIAGWTLSSNFPTVGGYQSVNKGNYGAFITKILLGIPPNAVSVIPSSGSGTSQTFTFQVSDSAGASDLSSVSVLFNSSQSVSNACSVTYIRSANSLALLTDAGANPGSTITPGSGSQQNSQCVLNGSGSSVTLAGNTFTLTLAVTFRSAFSGGRSTYLQAANPYGSTGWQLLGSWTVPTVILAPVSITPSSGTGYTQVFSLAYTDPTSYSSISSASVLFNSSLVVSSACYFFYYQPTNRIYLYNDAGTTWSTSIVLGTTGSIGNSQCSLNAATSSAAGSGNTLTLTLALTFLPAFSGTRSAYMSVNDGADSGWHQLGSWTVPAATLTPVSITPAAGNGASQTFSLVYTDPKGYASISSASVIFNSGLVVSSACYLFYYQPTNRIYLYNDAGTTWANSIVLGTTGSIGNSQCSLNAAISSAAGSGNTLTLNLALTFQVSFAGARSIYMEVYDGIDSGWRQLGSWTVPSVTLAPISITPNSGGGNAQTFSLVYTDPAGFGSISSVSVIFNTSLAVPGACYLFYYQPTNTIYLSNDTGSTWLSSIVLGRTGSIGNSQCSLNAAASSAVGSGNAITLNLALSFLPAFKGTRNIYMEVYGSGDSGWLQKGSWTIP